MLSEGLLVVRTASNVGRYFLDCRGQGVSFLSPTATPISLRFEATWPPASETELGLGNQPVVCDFGCVHQPQTCEYGQE